jgi:hypothetical protein
MEGGDSWRYRENGLTGVAYLLAGGLENGENGVADFNSLPATD